MVYRVTGVFRRRIDELRPYFEGAELIEEPDTEVLRVLAGEPDGANVEVRASAPGFYVHWWSTHPAADRSFGVAGLDEQELRNIVFTSIGRWTDELYQKERYVDFGRRSGDLVVGHYHLLPYAADAALSARLIAEGADAVITDRRRVEAIVRERLSTLVAERAEKS
jgi:hypothetical protein